MAKILSSNCNDNNNKIMMMIKCNVKIKRVLYLIAVKSQ